MPALSGLGVSAGRVVRAGACLAALGGLAGCGGTVNHPITAVSTLPPTQEAALYKAHAKPRYAPPGPPDDPWGPYVSEASRRFDVPPTWIHEVMQVESAGYQFRASGELTTSPVGAMGLMQLMPATYDEMKAQYGLGDDAFEPHDNIMAGAAYLRQMYDAFGSPGFLAAYNAGPSRLQDYLVHNRPLPDETRRYVRMIGPRIAGVWPDHRAAAEQLAVNMIPIDIPAGPRWHVVASRGRHHHGKIGHESSVQVASLARRSHGRHAAPGAAPVEVAMAPEPRVAARAAVALAMATPAKHGGGLQLHLIEPAVASERANLGGRDWAVQVGAFSSHQKAAAAAGAAGGAIHARAAVASGHSGRATVYQARVGGLTHDAAVQACRRLAHKGGGCMIVSPASE
jgi:hypothetical protein